MPSKPKVFESRFRGRIKKVTELSEYGMIVDLDNGVQVSFYFNANYIHLHFSGIPCNFGSGVKIQEAASQAPNLQLPNYLNIDYKSRIEEDERQEWERQQEQKRQERKERRNAKK